jgi:type VII secretion protein EccB
MQTRRDQLQAYRFVTRRIVSALLSGEPETNERPMRRYGLAVFGSAMIATIVFAVAGVIGFLFPSGAKLQDTAIVIERETGARYVFIGGELHPVLNFASARLILGSENPTIQRVSQRSLQGYPRGEAVGIPNLPDPLPARSAIDRAPWSGCSTRRSVGAVDLVTHLFVGSEPPGGQALGDRSLLVEHRDGDTRTRYLIANGQRFRITEASRTALGLSAARPIEVTQTIVAGMPPGPDLRAPSITDAGDEGPEIDGEPGKIGQIYVAADQHYVLLGNGLSPVGPVMRDLLLAKDPTVIPIPAAAAAAERSSSTIEPAGFPTSLPELAFANREPGMVCLVAGPADAGAVGVVLHERRPPLDPPTGRPSTGPDRTQLADAIHMRGGRAALVRLIPAPDDATPNTTTYLVTDQGIRHALPRVETAPVLSALGYGGIEPMGVPTHLLALLPVGPALDPAEAGKPVDFQE